MSKQLQDNKASTSDFLKAICESATIIDTAYRILWIHNPDLDTNTNMVGKVCYGVLTGKNSPCDGCPVKEVMETHRPKTLTRKSTNSEGKVCLREIRAYPITNRYGDIDKVVRISFSMNSKTEKQSYQIQNLNNLNRAIQNLSKMDLDVMDFVPDYRKPLSIREFEVLQLASYGLSNPQMAKVLSISSNTVKSHFDHIFNKLGVNNRTMAVLWAARQGHQPTTNDSVKLKN